MTKKKPQYTDFLLSALIPKFEEGSSNEGVFLNYEECGQILQVLKVSVSVESMIFNITELMKETYLCRFVDNEDAIDRTKQAIKEKFRKEKPCKDHHKDQ